MSDSNTVTEQPTKPNPIPNSKPFQKGDPRINRKGRPKSFDKLRDLAVSLANEAAKGIGPDGKTQIPIEIDGHGVSQIEMILRAMMKQNPERFIEIAFGKVPDQSENYNINLDDLSDEQLEKLASGSSIRSVLASKSKGKVNPETTTQADRADPVAE